MIYLSIRGFVEALSLISLFDYHQQQDRLAKAKAASRSSLPPALAVGKPHPESEYLKTDANLLSTAIGLLLRLMDASSGKKKLMRTHRSCVGVKPFVYR
jgi:hypothetical protein